MDALDFDEISYPDARIGLEAWADENDVEYDSADLALAVTSNTHMKNNTVAQIISITTNSKLSHQEFLALAMDIFKAIKSNLLLQHKYWLKMMNFGEQKSWIKFILIDKIVRIWYLLYMISD